MTYISDRIQLSSIIEDQLDRYNMQHPEDKMDAEGLFQRANHFYYRQKHPDRYTILWRWLEPELQDEPHFITEVRKTYKRKTIPKANTLNPELNSNIPLVKEAIENYLSGDYLLFDECWEDDPVNVVREPSKLFYMLARASEMDETDMIQAFYEGEGLEVLKYDSYCAYDIFEYYFTKSGLSNMELADKINLRGYKSSTIAKLLNRSDNITYDQFVVLAEALGIPDKWTKFCLYRLTQKKDRIPYKLGYEAWEDDFMENPDKAVTSLHSWEYIIRSKKYGTVSRLYRQMGYTLLSDIFPEQVDTTDSDAMSHTYMEIISPDCSRHILSLKEYEAVIKKVLAFASSYMETRLE